MKYATTQYLDRPDGRLSYDDNGVDGPLVIAAPGMGDMRHVYRHIRHDLAEAGIRFVTMDLRGMGDSSTEWKQLDDAAVASDYLALIEELNAGPAVLVGNSLSCASAVLASHRRPEPGLRCDAHWPLRPGCTHEVVAEGSLCSNAHPSVGQTGMGLVLPQEHVPRVPAARS